MYHIVSQYLHYLFLSFWSRPSRHVARNTRNAKLHRKLQTRNRTTSEIQVKVSLAGFSVSAKTAVAFCPTEVKRLNDLAEGLAKDSSMLAKLQNLFEIAALVLGAYLQAIGLVSTTALIQRKACAALQKTNPNAKARAGH